MGKVKIKKKSTLIDMTAMSDVTVLLLTFFMLTSTFLAKEPTTVHTPSSVSVEAVPAKDLVTVLVSSEDKSGKLQDPTAIEGKIFLSFQGDSVLASEPLREAILMKAIAIYNEQHPKNALPDPTTAQVEAFKKLSMFGMPFKDLYTVLNLEPAVREKTQSDLTQPTTGIPIDDNKDKNGRLNDFQIWMKALSQVAQEGRNDKIMAMGLDEMNPEDKDKIRELDILYNALFQGNSISVKADKDTPFTTIHRVFDNLQTMGLNKFTLMTNLKNEEGN